MARSLHRHVRSFRHSLSSVFRHVNWDRVKLGIPTSKQHSWASVWMFTELDFIVGRCQDVSPTNGTHSATIRDELMGGRASVAVFMSVVSVKTKRCLLLDSPLPFGSLYCLIFVLLVEACRDRDWNPLPSAAVLLAPFANPLCDHIRLAPACNVCGSCPGGSCFLTYCTDGRVADERALVSQCTAALNISTLPAGTNVHSTPPP